jgi:hypothetical protein
MSIGLITMAIARIFISPAATIPAMIIGTDKTDNTDKIIASAIVFIAKEIAKEKDAPTERAITLLITRILNLCKIAPATRPAKTANA